MQNVLIIPLKVWEVCINMAKSFSSKINFWRQKCGKDNFDFNWCSQLQNHTLANIQPFKGRENMWIRQTKHGFELWWLNSEELTLDVGCVQGSVLFNMYLSDIPKVLKDARIFAYSDDTYVCIEERDDCKSPKDRDDLFLYKW